MKSLLSKDEKTKLLEALRSSGQTQAAFAEINGINPKTLARWIYQQRLEARQNQNNVEFVEVKRTVVKIRQEIIIRKAGIEIEMPSFDASSLKGGTLLRKNSFPGTLKLRRSSLALESALSAMHSFLKQNFRKLILLLMPAAVPV